MPPTIIGSPVSAEATSVTLPVGHKLGDILVGFAFRDGSTTAPTAPSPWTSVLSTPTTTLASFNLAWKPCLSAAESSGTWTNATGLIIVCLRNADFAAPILTSSGQGNTTNTAQWNTLSDANLRGTCSNKILLFIGHRSTDQNTAVAPAGATNIHALEGATNDMACHEVAADDAWPTTTLTLTGTASGWLGVAVAVRGSRFELRNDIYRGFKAGTGNAGVMSIGGLG